MKAELNPCWRLFSCLYSWYFIHLPSLLSIDVNRRIKTCQWPFFLYTTADTIAVPICARLFPVPALQAFARPLPPCMPACKPHERADSAARLSTNSMLYNGGARPCPLAESAAILLPDSRDPPYRHQSAAMWSLVGPASPAASYPYTPHAHTEIGQDVRRGGGA